MQFYAFVLPLLAVFGSSAANCVLGGRSELVGRDIPEDPTKPNFCATHEGIFADPFNCRRFVTCTGGVLAITVCAPGEMFNPVTKACEATTFTSCKQRKLYCADKWSPLNGTEDAFEPVDEDLTSIGNAWPLLKERAGGNRRGGNRREGEEAQDDIILPPHNPATDGKPPRGVVGIPSEQYNAIASIVPTDTVTCTGKDGKAPVLVAANTPCPQFTICIRGSAFLATCAGGLQFDAKTKKCLPAGLAHCATTIPACDNPFGIQQIPGFCDRYVVCCNDSATVYYCKAGFTFDTATLGCTLSSKATCTP